MKIFLAGCEDTQFTSLVTISGNKNLLFSYFHWLGTSPANKAKVFEMFNASDLEVICDSGLFTLMFGVGKGGDYDLAYMTDYTQKYIETAKTFGIKNLTIVESDVHKLLGMPAVFELRKYFEDSGLPCLYVWHKEEGLDGLMRMAEKYDYIALSIPELRILCKGTKQRYQSFTHQLLFQIRNHVGEAKMPKIHLLGNTVQETMETTLAYSCDSTSWLSGGRYGTAMAFQNNRLIPIRRRGDRYEAWRKTIFPQYEQMVKELTEWFGHNPVYFDYQACNLFSALSYRRCQDYLDIHYPWMGLRRKNAEPS